MRDGTSQRLAFNIYRDLGARRSLEALHESIKRNREEYGFKRVPGLRTIARWSKELHWQDRIADLEREARRQDAETFVQALREMNERQAREGLLLQQKAVQRFQSMATDDLSTADAIRALAEGARLERLARGDVTDRTSIERTDDIDLSGFSMAELRTLAQLGPQGNGRAT